VTVPLDDAGWLRRRYLDEGASTREIAREVGRDRKTVRTALRRHGIPARPPGRVTPPAVRPGDRFGRLVVVAEAPRERRLRPKERAYVCACDCGGEKIVGRGPLRGGAVLSCGCLRREVMAEARARAQRLPRDAYGRYRRGPT
jgi:hypothetical protein